MAAERPLRCLVPALLVGLFGLMGAAGESAQPSPKTSEASPPPAQPDIRAQLQADAATLRPLFTSPMVHRFLDATSALPDPGTRAVWRSADRTKAFSQAEYDALTEADRAGLTKRECTATFYYTTGFGSPLIYARPLQIAADNGFDATGASVLDFGYGLIGHLRLLASLGADAHGVDVEPLFRALYSWPGDTGAIAAFTGDGAKGPDGDVTIHHGRWPAEADVTKAIGGGYDLFISKNVLKRSYIHPEREVDPKFLVHLGVDDETFVRAMHDVLKPGGLALIYNISPPQNPADKPYLPHADSRCPFARDLLEKSGFEVIALDLDDSAAAIAMWNALGYFQPEEQAEPQKHLFVRYTLLRRK